MVNDVMVNEVMVNEKPAAEPVIRVGLQTAVPSVELKLEGSFVTSTGIGVSEGTYTATHTNGEITLRGTSLKGAQLALTPIDRVKGRFTIHGITIGIQFHWERKESQTFQGSLRLEARPPGINVINEIPIESYLTSVISSEMSASSPGELLRSHAIVSRSWLLFQLRPRVSSEGATGANPRPDEIIRWYDRESHREFDVCADDHCQRYQGISKGHSQAVFEATRDTRGQVLTYAGQICDARYSKSCGGMTEAYGAAWQDISVPYLSPVYDGSGTLEGYGLPLTDEANAEQWIRSTPAAFCNVRSPELLAQVLPGFDQETPDFYRWRVEYTAEEMSSLVRDRLGIDCGSVLDLSTVQRGDSGRIIKLRITGADRSVVIGKELEIRRALSRSHLYSSALVVEKDQTQLKGTIFRISGAGWGHGVGLCQIGAAAMAAAGYDARDILTHYFKDASIETLY